MLLTTLALVKRKVGKLPTRRCKLYAEAVSVLLNWNPRHYVAIDEEEAIPQLEYLSWEMCNRGVQRLTEDEILTLLENVRRDYPNLRPLRRRTPEQFLADLEARSSLLIRSGVDWLQGKAKGKPLWEFRHLTFQEYLAGRAMLDGRYPGREKSKSLAEQVAPLAGSVSERQRNEFGRGGPESEWEVVEAWQETLRLLVADCKDDDVDDVLNAIATPLASENADRTRRARAILAARCMADEPNASEEAANSVIESFVQAVGSEDGAGGFEPRTAVDHAAMELARSLWGVRLGQLLVVKFRSQTSVHRESVGAVAGTVEMMSLSADPHEIAQWRAGLPERLNSSDLSEAVSAALATMVAAFSRRGDLSDEVLSPLLNLLGKDPAATHAAAWALWWLAERRRSQELGAGFRVPDVYVQRLVASLEQAAPAEEVMRILLIRCLGIAGDSSAVGALIAALNDPMVDTRDEAIRALGEIGDVRAVEALASLLERDEGGVSVAIEALATIKTPEVSELLRTRLHDSKAGVRIAEILYARNDPEGAAELVRLCLRGESASVRMTALGAWAGGRSDNEKVALSRDADGLGPWLDLRDAIDSVRLAKVGVALSLPVKDAEALFETLAAQLPLRLEWLGDTST